MSYKKAYREFCQVTPDLPIFVQDWYLDANCTEGQWDVVLVEEGDRVVATLPYFWKQKGPFRYVTMPPFVKTMGPYLIPEYRGVLKKEHVLLQQLISLLPKFDGFKQNFHCSVTNWLPFYWHDFRQTTYYTYRIGNLQNIKSVYNNFNRNIRRNIKKAQQQVRVCNDFSPERFYQINQQSFDRQDIAIPYSWEQFRRQDEALVAQHARELFFAVDKKERIHSAAYLIWDETTAYYHLSGDDPQLRASGAGILLVWEAMRFASEELGLEQFDFEGSMLSPVEHIRVQFGADQVPYFFIWKYNSRLYQFFDWLKAGIF